MKRLLAALAAASLLTVAACGSSDDNESSGGTTKVNFGYIADFNGASLLAVADDQKLWEKHGIEVSTKVFTNGPLQITAINAGDLDFGYIGPGAVWLPASGKAKIVALNSLGNADRVIAQPGITDLAQLKGKKVGVPEGTSGDMILTLALEKAGLSATDIQRVPMDPATIVSAFASGQIDAAGIWYPLLNNIKQKKPDLVELAKNEDFADSVSFPTAFVAGNEAVSGKADTVTKVVQVLREAMDFRAANHDKAVELTAGLLKQPADAVKADAANSKMLDSKTLDGYTADGTVDKWLKGMGDYFVGAKKLPDNPDPSTYYLGSVFTGAASK
ncbi:aliphatic sulfonate ABC transporter substrate-binding protein [Actinoplanes sp. LDG1-06]|uniref:Aliphatic sulfonate ABC transporter substrate-binding protein n=1 Tax=Paractinoplanes ovalisporus TaxID=2810368 RepID=A0ABS2AG01_9ACTN|nr:aliphatic sulfonate ABC transporter substrate-binding protein [Actinoplanes ovalisporus]MBM2618186.1 aliphatic sulfonate ABC transporter substrate-binding protein [Actinoplanes ovalisporus]